MASQGARQDVEAMMKEKCESLWKDVNKNQAVLKSHSGSDLREDTENVMAAISEVRVKCLQGEIDAVKEKEIQALPNHPVILETLLRSQLERAVSQLEECLAVVEGRRKELEDDLERQEELLTQHREMASALELRLGEAQQGSQKSRPTEDSQVKLLQRKQKKAREIQNRLLKQIADFIGKHFPLPSQDTTRNSKGELCKFTPLLDMIELLMNTGMGGDLDPYIPVSEVFWPPYVELLLRCGIASRHPQDANRIRLVPLHL
ncbi:centromere protein K-like [Diadema antillarum]|uniref:centromere protein K-like n=1 Tax=Diadema antillarum TaxID=105358 RepID=UPI003A83A7EE